MNDTNSIGGESEKKQNKYQTFFPHKLFNMLGKYLCSLQFHGNSGGGSSGGGGGFSETTTTTIPTTTTTMPTPSESTTTTTVPSTTTTILPTEMFTGMISAITGDINLLALVLLALIAIGSSVVRFIFFK
jgi:hypothetical protein